MSEAGSRLQGITSIEEKNWRERLKHSYWLYYTVLFVCVSAAVFYSFIRDGRSFVNRVDGLNQQYNCLLYLHRWGRQVWENLRNTGSLEIPLWDFHMGLGADAFTTVFYYVCMTPTAIGAVFCPERWLEHFYALEFLFRLYMAGISFSLFARTWQKNQGAVLLGSMSYCFCGFVMQKGIQHTFFIIPMVFLPLLLLGADKIYRRQSSALFIIAAAMGAMGNLYYFYMTILVVVLYVLLRYFFLEEEKSFRRFFSWIGKFALYGVIAIAIAAFIFLPMVAAMFGSSRPGASNEVPLLYHISYYYKLFWGICTNELRDFDSRTGYTVTALLAVFLLLVRKGEKQLKISLAVLTACLCIPAAGSVFNGFGYVSNRWIFAYSLLISCIFTKLYPAFYELTEKETVRLLCAAGGYLLLGNLIPLFGVQANAAIYRAGIWLAVVVTVLAAIRYFQLSKRYITILLWAGTLGSIFLNAYYEYSPVFGSTVSRYVKRGEVLEEYAEKLPSNRLKEIEDIDSYRSIVYAEGELENSYVLQEMPGCEFYYSVVVGSVNQLHRKMYYNEPMEHKYNGFDNRLILDSLAGVKYYLTDGQEAEMFGNMEKREGKEESDQYSIYENPYALLPVYFYDCYIPASEWEEMGVTDRQEAMLYGAVVEESSLPEAVPEFTNYEIGYQIETVGQVAAGENGYTVTGSGASVVLQLEQVPQDGELYVIVEGLGYEGISPVDLYAGGNLFNTDWQNRQIIRDAQAMYQEKDDIFIQIRAGEREKDFNYFTRMHRMYCGKEDFLCNLGYVEEGPQEIMLNFSDTGIYTFSSMRVAVQPYSEVEEQLVRLQQGGVSDWQMSTNEIAGKADCSKKQMLCVTVPYSAGWKAYVDGEEVSVKKVNTAFMGVELEAGTHEFRFVYSTLYLKLGMLVSLAGIMGFLGCMIAERRQRGRIHKREIENGAGKGEIE